MKKYNNALQSDKFSAELCVSPMKFRAHQMMHSNTLEKYIKAVTPGLPTRCTNVTPQNLTLAKHNVIVPQGQSNYAVSECFYSLVGERLSATQRMTGSSAENTCS